MIIPFPHNQSIFFDNGQVEKVEDVVRIEKGNWYHLFTREGEEIITNPKRILFVKVMKPEDYERC